MSIRKDICANYLGTAVQVLAPLLSLPWYLNALGAPVYGLLSFVVLLQTVLALVDAGISQALVREFSMRHGRGAAGRHELAALLFGVERLYWFSGLALGAIAGLMAPVVVEQWIRLDGLSSTLGLQAVLGGAAIFAAQFPGSPYRSVLVGMDQQVALNRVLVVWTVVRHAVGVMLVVRWPTLSVYLAWHAAAALAETGCRGRLAWRAVSVPRASVRWASFDGRGIWRSVLGMSGAVFLGAVTVHVDRVILSRMVGLEQFGYYTVAATLALGALYAVNPLTMATLPRAIQARDDPALLRRLSLRLLVMNGAVVLLALGIFVVAGEWLLMAWLRDAKAVDVIFPILSVMLIGTALNALYNVGYVNWLARGRMDRIFKVNLVALAISVVTIPVLVSRLGPIGAAFGWVAMNFIGLLLSLEWLVPRLLTSEGSMHLLRVFKRKLRTAYRRYVQRDPLLLEADRWVRDRGDTTLRLDYALDASSTVLDLGGYQGDFTAAIHERYGCRVFVFEPVQAFHEACERRFAANSVITCLRFGLASVDAEMDIALDADASSLLRRPAGKRERIRMRSISGFLRESGIDRIDLLKINIEGGEFDVLPALIESGDIGRVAELQVQFHDFVPDAVARRDEIRSWLSRTHEETWNYVFVWENWRRRSPHVAG